MRRDGFLKLFFTMPIFGYAKMLGIRIIDKNTTAIADIKALMILDFMLMPPLILGMIILKPFATYFFLMMIFLFLHAFGLQLAIRFKNRP